MFKKIVTIVLAVVMCLAACACFASCNTTEENGDGLKVGVILVGDETEGYTLAHMNGMDAAVAALKAEGKNVTVTYKKSVPEDNSVATNANDLIADGCTLIITNSYGHQFHISDVVKANPSVNFVCMTGDLAAGSAEKNDFNAFTDVYESRYVSGVIAGLKLKELVDSGKLTAEKVPASFDADGNIKIGYVGAFNYQEVVSGYTAFYLGVKSVVSNISMTVKYTNSWFSEEREAAVAEYLMANGCVIIGQHADSTGAPAAVQKAYNKNNDLLCFSVGYNVDMLDVAPDVVLTSSTNNWEVYYKTLFAAAHDGKDIPADWSEGYSQNAVGTTALGKNCAAGTKEAVDSVVAKIKSGEIRVFDCSTFTVSGANLTTYTSAYNMNGAECIAKDGDVYYFSESTIRSAPYFDIRIDGIKEESSDYAE